MSSADRNGIAHRRLLSGFFLLTAVITSVARLALPPCPGLSVATSEQLPDSCSSKAGLLGQASADFNYVQVQGSEVQCFIVRCTFM